MNVRKVLQSIEQNDSRAQETITFQYGCLDKSLPVVRYYNANKYSPGKPLGMSTPMIKHSLSKLTALIIM